MHVSILVVDTLPLDPEPALQSASLPSLLTHHSAIARARQGVIADAMADAPTISSRPRPFSKPIGPSPPKSSSSSSSSGQPSPDQQRVTITLKDPKPFPSKVVTGICLIKILSGLKNLKQTKALNVCCIGGTECLSHTHRGL